MIAVEGEIDEATVPAVREELVAAAESDADLVVVDLDGVSFIGSAGIGSLLAGAMLVGEHGGQLALAAPRPPVRRALELTGVDRRVEVAPSIDAAVAAARNSG